MNREEYERLSREAGHSHPMAPHEALCAAIELFAQIGSFETADELYAVLEKDLAARLVEKPEGKSVVDEQLALIKGVLEMYRGEFARKTLKAVTP